MSSWGPGSAWLRDGRRVETSPSLLRALLITAITLGVFFIVVALLMSMSGCTTATNSGIKGTVTIGPTEPVATAGTSSASKPFATSLLITEQGGQHLKRPARVKSDASGAFSIDLEPGTYVIEADGPQPPPTLTPVTVEVVADRYTDVRVEFDSGIR
jgi:hypothetical protein